MLLARFFALLSPGSPIRIISPIFLLLLTGTELMAQSGFPPTPADDFATTDEDVSIYTFVVPNDTDPDGTVIPTTISLAGAFMHGMALVDALNGAIVYVPNPDFNGQDSIAYRICDNDGLCATATLFVDVNPVNDAPVLVRDVVESAEDVSMTLFPLTNDADSRDPAGGLNAASLSVVDSFRHGSVVAGTEPGTWLYTPDADWNGSDSLQYRVCDTGNPLPAQCSTAWFRVDITPVNDGPRLGPLAEEVWPTCLDPIVPWPDLVVWDPDGGTITATVTVVGGPVFNAGGFMTDPEDQASWTFSSAAFRTAPMNGAQLGYALRRLQYDAFRASAEPEERTLEISFDDGIAEPVVRRVRIRPDWMDPTRCDADTDGLADGVECAGGWPCDADGDGIPNHLDLDSDDDGLADSDEREAGDCQANGVPDFLDPISCDIAVRPQWSPNGDGLDDRFYVGGIAAYPANRLQVFDASGREVFSAQPYQNDWRGDRQVPGLYFYALWLDHERAKPDFSGPVLLGR